MIQGHTNKQVEYIKSSELNTPVVLCESSTKEIEFEWITSWDFIHELSSERIKQNN